MTTKLVRFVRKAPPYNAGEAADLPVAEADALLALGVAVDPEAPAAPDAPAEATPTAAPTASPAAEESAASAALGSDLTHALSVPEVQELVADARTVEELDEIAASEATFPDGPRDGVVQAVEARRAELDA